MFARHVVNALQSGESIEDKLMQDINSVGNYFNFTRALTIDDMQKIKQRFMAMKSCNNIGPFFKEVKIEEEEPIHNPLQIEQEELIPLLNNATRK